MEKVKTEWTLLVHTDAYAGNFEREMTAYATGRDLPRSGRFAELARKEIAKPMLAIIDGLLEQRMVEDDGQGWLEECEIAATPGWGNDGMGGHSRLNGKNNEKFKWPAYMTVAIFFEREPPAIVLDLIHRRCERFAELTRKSKLVKDHEDPFFHKEAITEVRMELVQVHVHEEREVRWTRSG